MKKTLIPNISSQHMFVSQKFENEEVIVESPPISTCEKVKEFRGNLIANVSHDLRTPLQSIIGYSETMLLKEKNISGEEQEKYLEIILANANKLSSMIENFFEYSKLEISEIVPDKKMISLQEVVQELYQNYSLIAAKADIQINIQVEDNLPHIYGDCLMIHRVFQNLIDNALKFTPSGGAINIALTRPSSEGIQVKISDTGTGIRHDELDAIFNKFKTSRNTSCPKEQNDGLGLGLAIVKKILGLHDAKILVNSELGMGTTFTLLFPVM